MTDIQPDIQLTVLSQSFPYNLWDTVLLDQTTLAKPIGDSSPDTYHECNPAALPIGGPRIAISQLILGPTLDFTRPFMLLSGNTLIKDDVFLASDSPLYPTSSFHLDQDDNASLSSHSTSSSQQLATSPHLSPVTSPTNFLYNHEPLFDGGIIEPTHESDDDILSVSTESTKQPSSSENDLDWYKLLDAFHEDVACDNIPSPRSEPTVFDEPNDDSEDEFSILFHNPAKNLKRARSQTPASELSFLDLDEFPYKRPTTNPRQKRRKKHTQALKKKEDKKKPAPSFTASRCQLIEPIANQKDNKTVFQHLTETSIDWCRYCGTTEGVNWRPGPWGKRTLCNKHGCDYKGYGLASRLPRLDLSAFSNERLQDRIRPVVQHFCIVCQSPEETENDNQLILCEGGCSRAYHQKCHAPMITVNPTMDAVRWYCSPLCKENLKRNKVVVELPRKHMPLMHLLKK
ncbi:hypothetical protein EDC96DRAFT_525214 [Choanephora cucurbitarum]|nr:hypothetical protein EDC96DRAFT_525214 [Choanephora cucurbitarum]